MMTNETKAPERIYMDGDIEIGDGYWTRCFEHPKQCSEPAIEYTRADLYDGQANRVTELEAQQSKDWKNINLKADFIDKNLNDIAGYQEYIAELEAENRELHTQIIASDGQAQIAYEEQERLEAKLAKAVDALNFVTAKISWEINVGNYSHEDVCDMNADWIELGNYVDAALAELKGTDQ